MLPNSRKLFLNTDNQSHAHPALGVLYTTQAAFITAGLAVGFPGLGAWIGRGSSSGDFACSSSPLGHQVSERTPAGLLWISFLIRVPAFSTMTIGSFTRALVKCSLVVCSTKCASDTCSASSTPSETLHTGQHSSTLGQGLHCYTKDCNGQSAPGCASNV